MDKREADRGILDDLSRWEVGEGIAIRTTTRIVEGDLKPSSVTEIFEQELVLLSTDASEEEEGTVEFGFNLKNFLARVSKEFEGVLLVETSAVGRFSSPSPLCAEGFIGVETGMGTGEERLVVLVKLGGEPLAEQGTDARGSA